MGDCGGPCAKEVWQRVVSIGRGRAGLWHGGRGGGGTGDGLARGTWNVWGCFGWCLGLGFDAVQIRGAAHCPVEDVTSRRPIQDK